MPTIRQRVLDYLSRHPEGADDDVLASALGLRRRQQANAVCRRLAEEGIVRRKRVDGKIRTFYIGLADLGVVRESEQAISLDAEKPWFWEGNVQQAIAGFLRASGYSVFRIADTRKREVGKDIEAGKDGQKLWVTIKGYPQPTPRTHPSTQAGHWFKDALFDMVSWRGENAKVELTMALPDFPRYRKLAQRVSWLQPVLPFSFCWVREDGTVVIEEAN